MKYKLLVFLPERIGIEGQEAKCRTQEISRCVHYERGKVLWRVTMDWILSLPEKVANACCGLNPNFGEGSAIDCPCFCEFGSSSLLSPHSWCLSC